MTPTFIGVPVGGAAAATGEPAEAAPGEGLAATLGEATGETAGEATTAGEAAGDAAAAGLAGAVVGAAAGGVVGCAAGAGLEHADRTHAAASAPRPSCRHDVTLIENNRDISNYLPFLLCLSWVPGYWCRVNKPSTPSGIA
jgi:hypothetical protein